MERGGEAGRRGRVGLKDGKGIGDERGKGDGKGLREKRMWRGEDGRMGRSKDERGRETEENKMVGGVYMKGGKLRGERRMGCGIGLRGSKKTLNFVT